MAGGCLQMFVKLVHEVSPGNSARPSEPFLQEPPAMRLRTAFLSVLALLALAATVKAADNPRPNILFLLADDQAYDTVGALGNREIQTPNLDRLVERGV